MPGILFDSPVPRALPTLVDGDPEDPEAEPVARPIRHVRRLVGGQRRGLRLGAMAVRAAERRTRPDRARSLDHLRQRRGVQLRGVALDNLVVSTGEGSTSFEDDGDSSTAGSPATRPRAAHRTRTRGTTISVLEPPPPPPDPPTVTPTDGAQMLFSEVSDTAYKRLTRVLTIPSGGSTLSFDTFHDTEPAGTSCSWRSGPPAATTGHARGAGRPHQPGCRRVPVDRSTSTSSWSIT